MGIDLRDLAQIDLFRGIDFRKIPEAVETAPVIDLAPGEVVLSPDQENTSLFILLSGTLFVHLEGPETPSIRTIRPGSCVGELSLIEEIRPSAWVTVDEAASLMVMDHTRLWDMVAADGRISKNLLSIVSRRVIANTELIMLGKVRIRELEQTAIRDSLTRIYNRRWFDQAMVVHMNRFHREAIPFTLCMADLDKFKTYNDDNGHPAGDRALAAVARTLAGHLRPHDAVARYGGEEFAVILSDTKARDAGPVVQRLLDLVRTTGITDDQGRELPGVTLSAGLAEPEPGDTAQELIRRADQALYRAKAAGRDCCCTDC